MNLNKLKVYQPAPDSGGTGGGGGNSAYVRSSPTTISVGGYPAGSLPNGTVQDVLDKMFYPYQNPAFTAFAVQGMEAAYELGEPSGDWTRTFVWATSQSQNVQPSSMRIWDVNRGVPLRSNMANDGSEALLITSITYNAPTLHTWRIDARNTNNQSFNATTSVPWRARRWAGRCNASGLSALLAITSATDLYGLPMVADVDDLVMAKPGPRSYNCSGGPEAQHIFFLWDSTLGTASFTSGAAPAAFRPLRQFAFTNLFGVVRQYNLYVSSNAYNGSAVQITVI